MAAMSVLKEEVQQEALVKLKRALATFDEAGKIIRYHGLSQSYWLPFVLAAREFLSGRTQAYQVLSIWLRVDGLSLLMAGTILLLGTLVILFSGSYMAGEVGEEKYYAMLLAMMGLMIGLVTASDLFNLWVWFEGMAISSYLLVAFYRGAAKKLRGWETTANGALALAAIVGCTGLLVHSFLDFNLQVPANAALFYTLATLGAAQIVPESIRRKRSNSLLIEEVWATSA